MHKHMNIYIYIYIYCTIQYILCTIYIYIYIYISYQGALALRIHLGPWLSRCSVCEPRGLAQERDLQLWIKRIRPVRIGPLGHDKSGLSCSRTLEFVEELADLLGNRWASWLRRCASRSASSRFRICAKSSLSLSSCEPP